MRRLISANLYRLLKSKLIWFFSGLILLISVISMLGCNPHLPIEMLESNYFLIDKYFTILPLLGLFFAAFSALYVGTEYGDGTRRNKLIAGYSKVKIYFSMFFIELLANLIMFLFWMISGIMGIEVFKLGTVGLSNFILYIFLYILSMMALNSIFILLTMLIGKKAESTVACVFIYILMLVCASGIYNSLSEPEMVSDLIIGGNGSGAVYNPDYLGGNIRTLFELLIDFIPIGQMIKIANIDMINFGNMILSSISVIIISTMIGVYFFNKKDIK